MPILPDGRSIPRSPGLVPRAITPRLLEALGDSRAVAVIGPRQSGKTTLVRDLIRAEYPATYVTLDEAATRNAALADPTGFIAELTGPTIIDEVQRAPDLLLAIKERLDRDDRPGQFLITGSANIQTLPTIRDALPGRVEYVPLWPFAQSEIECRDGLLVDRLFAGEEPSPVEDEAGRRHVAARIAAGGFPGALRRTPRSRIRFFEAYTDSVVGRDVPDVARTRDAGAVGRLLRLLAARSASLLRLESLARDLGVDRKTVERYLRILQDLMLVRIHPPWHPNLSHREVKTPKVYVTDTAMMAALVGASTDRIATDPVVAGMAFETFVAMEMLKLSSWAASSPRLFHYRDRDGREVDVVLGRADGSIVGLEVKSAATVVSADFRSLAYLRDKLGSRFVRGVVLYAGTRALPFGERLSALPLSCLWS
jgi:predicted AAA+ superfamily ATPase